ncbi:hypothetical protein PLICRDRAFT_170766 [Plicaturopsis crispa FD-325 SS-3]|nr:hypothetical protein PLICRDRAFT_170766 [Plicaturopsis crispa FD-325 SS-3]
MLGSFPVSDEGSELAPTIIRVAKTPLQSYDALGTVRDLGTLYLEEQNDVVKSSPLFPDLPGTIIKPYIDSFPPSRTQWVEDILSGKAEADKVIYRDASPDFGFVILPDAKWDLTTLFTLYLVTIAYSRSIRSLRDLNKTHLGMLQASGARQSVWCRSAGAYPRAPPGYHFHVHIVNANQSALAGTGMLVGQAHLLDDIISHLELDADDGPSRYERRTLTYGLGDQHGLYEALKAAEAGLQL